MTEDNNWDDASIERFRSAIPSPDPAYRSRVRRTLSTPRPSLLARLGWQRPALGMVSLAVAIAFAVALLPLSPRGSDSASAAALLARVIRATTQPLVDSGTAKWTSSASADQLVPTKASLDLGAMHMTSVWAIADSSHFRIETKTSSPPLEAQTSIYAGDGGASAIWYSDINATAIRMPLSKKGNPAEEFLTGGALPPIAGSIRQYVDRYNHLKSGVHARLLGQQSYLGRTADVVEVRPVSSVTSSSCSRDAHGKQHCRDVMRGYGREHIWVDHEHLVILKVQVTGLPRQQGGNYTYRVTSINFGQQPTADQLAFTSPVPITNPQDSSQSAGSTGSESIGSSTGWQAPSGFLNAGAPTGPRGELYTSSGSGQMGEPGGQGTAGASVLFARGRTHLSATTSNFVLIQERKRENGPPSLFSTGPGRTAGRCNGVTGTFPDGLNWLGFARKDIYVMVSSDNLSQENLVRYVATAMCT